jgi:hypothetical protein
MKKLIYSAILIIFALSCRERSSLLKDENDISLKEQASKAGSPTLEFMRSWNPNLASSLEENLKKLNLKVWPVHGLDMDEPDPKEAEKIQVIQNNVKEFGDDAPEIKIDPYTLNEDGAHLNEFFQFTVLLNQKAGENRLLVDPRIFNVRKAMGISYQILPVVLADSKKMDIAKSEILKTLKLKFNDSFHLRLYVAKLFFDELKPFEVAKRGPSPEEWTRLKLKYGIVE